MGSWHAGNLVTQPGVEVVAVADVVDAAAAGLAAAVGARVGPADEIIEADDVDAVLVATSDDTHSELAVATIAAGKPCFLEKPISSSVDGARQILEAELSAGRVLTRVGFMRELDPAHVQLAGVLPDLGAITRVRCVHRNVDSSPRPANRLFAQSIIHDIHTIRWLTGEEFDRVSVHVVNRSDGFRDILLIGELTGGALGTIEFEDQGFAYEVHVEVTAAGGMAATLTHPRVVSRRDASESIEVGTDWFGRFEDAYRLEIEEWARTLTGGRRSGPTVWDGYAAQVVAEAAEVAMVGGGAVSVELPPRPSMYSPTH
jgi:myo-inositol 2-dehydrogenase/D-chiro-inositol 1-dehydrogenase